VLAINYKDLTYIYWILSRKICVELSQTSAYINIKFTEKEKFDHDLVIKRFVCIIILIFLLFRSKGKIHQCQETYQVWEQVHQLILTMEIVCV